MALKGDLFSTGILTNLGKMELLFEPVSISIFKISPLLSLHSK